MYLNIPPTYDRSCRYLTLLLKLCLVQHLLGPVCDTERRNESRDAAFAPQRAPQLKHLAATVR